MKVIRRVDYRSPSAARCDHYPGWVLRQVRAWKGVGRPLGHVWGRMPGYVVPVAER